MTALRRFLVWSNSGLYRVLRETFWVFSGRIPIVIDEGHLYPILGTDIHLQ